MSDTNQIPQDPNANNIPQDHDTNPDHDTDPDHERIGLGYERRLNDDYLRLNSDYLRQYTIDYGNGLKMVFGGSSKPTQFLESESLNNRTLIHSSLLHINLSGEKHSLAWTPSIPEGEKDRWLGVNRKAYIRLNIFGKSLGLIILYYRGIRPNIYQHVTRYTVANILRHVDQANYVFHIRFNFSSEKSL